MADELSAMFNKASISDNDREYYENYLYQHGYVESQVNFIINTAYNLLDTYPGKYKTLQAINKAIKIMEQNYYYQGGGQLKHTKSRKVSRKTKSNKQHRSSKRNTRRTIKK